MRNYCGLLLSATQYRNFGFQIENKLTFHSNKRVQESVERMWFMCGYENSIYMIIASDTAEEAVLLRSGLILDIRGIGETSSANSFFDHAVHRLTSLTERISLCNALRDMLACRKRIRWCGAEYESLYHRSIVQNAVEINGLAVLGRYMTTSGTWKGVYPYCRNNDHSSDVLRDVRRYADHGQKKLCVLFHSIALPHTTIIYVGASPGHAWMGALPYYKSLGKVVAIDTRELVYDTHMNIEFIQRRVTAPGDLYDVVADHAQCIFIWDVRGDAPRGSVDREKMLLEEITTVNMICSDQRLMEHFILLHIKINMCYFTSYCLPENGKYMLQPYTLQRDIYEVRYVAHISRGRLAPCVTPSELAKQSILTELDEVRNRLSDRVLCESNLVANMLTSRYRECDYITAEAYNSSIEEIYLYTINHNPGEKIIPHLARLRESAIPYFVSFFTGEALSEGEHAFPEGEVVLNELGTVLDSRSFLQAKVENLYFLLSDSLIDLFREEEFTSETYKIRKTEYAVVTRSRIPTYDLTRRDACARGGFIFPKFPANFSIADTILSPSGHALRMVLEYLAGHASIALFVQKIVSNFRSIQRGHVKKRFGESQLKPGDSTYASILRHRGEKSSGLERSPKTIWHSPKEWILGIQAAVLMSEPTPHQQRQIDAVVEWFNRVIYCSSLGIEISTFYMSAFGTMSPLHPPRRTRACDDFSATPEDKLRLADCLLRFLRAKPDQYVINWLTRGDASAQSRVLWRNVILRFRADAIVRDYLCHNAYVNELTSEFPDHGISRMSPLEFVLSCYFESVSTPHSGSRLLHYWNNAYRPEHLVMRKLFPQFGVHLRRMDSFNDILVFLSESQTVFDGFYSTMNPEDYPDCMMREKHLREMVVDLIARHWQNEYPDHRGVNPSVIARVPVTSIDWPTVDCERVQSILDEFTSKDLVYLRFNVQQRVKSAYAHLYP